MPHSPSAWSMIPFGIVLLAIAIGPALFHNWWNKHYPKLTLSLAAITLLYYLFGVSHGTDAILHTGHEYIGFIALIGSLYVVSGGRNNTRTVSHFL